MIATGQSLKAETMMRAIKGRSLWVDARRRLFRNRAAMASAARELSPTELVVLVSTSSW